MKKSNIIKLVLVAATLASCNKNTGKEKNVYLRSDTTARYSHVHGGGFHGGYFVFRPYGIYNNGSYSRAGFYSSAIHKNANVGSNSYKATVVRGGFGSSSFHVSS